MNVSVASYSFYGLARAGMMDVFGYLETCKYRYGLTMADIWNGMLDSTEQDYLAKVREALDERELALANLCVDKAHILEDDPDQQEANHQNALAHLRAADILGARTIRIDAGGGHDDLAFTEEQMDMVVRRYQEYAQYAGDHGFKVGPENHWGPERVPANMRAIIEAVDSPAFGMLLYFGNWRGQDADQGDELIAPYAMHTHLSWDITEGPVATKMAMLRDAGYAGCWGVEHHTGKNEYTEVALQVGRVRDQLERWRTAD